jgi:polyketide biosynthesis 3-hydroxy-3-methylglutaryl-CoA synthase-like enzyme PksG
MPSLNYCQRVGNIMGATVYLALASTIDNGNFDQPKRLGVFSYGSGCCSEFYSGIVTGQGQERQRQFNLAASLENREMLTMKEYESTFITNELVKFGTRDFKIDTGIYPLAFNHVKGKNRVIFSGINNYHRKYEWV